MIKKHILDNGTRIIVEQMEHIKSTSIGFWIKAGSVDENSTNNGISHLIEHMAFKGTEKRSVIDIAEEIDGIGGRINAYTSKEYTCYYSRVISENFEQTADVMYDMIFNALMDENEIIKEKDVILEEILMYEDSPEDCVHELLIESAFKGTKLELPVLGTRESLEKINRNNIIRYMENNYCPSNIVVSVVGNLDCDYVFECISKLFSNNNKKNTDKGKYSLHKTLSGINTVHKEIEQIHFCVGINGFDVYSEYIYSYAILNDLFGGSMSSRLFQNIREKKGYAYSIYSFNSAFRNGGIMGVYSAVNKNKIEDIFTDIKKEFDEILKGKIDREEFEKSKNHIRMSNILSIESPSSRMNILGRREILDKELYEPEHIIKMVEDEKYNKIQDLCQLLNDNSEYSVAIAGDLSDNSNVVETAKRFFGGINEN